MLPVLFLLVPHALATDVLLAEFSPRTVSDFEVASSLGAAATEALRAAGYAVAGPEDLAGRVGSAAIGCAEASDCPDRLWAAWPDAQLAVVGMVGASEGGIRATIRLHRPGLATPLEEITLYVPPGGDQSFAGLVVERARAQLGPRDPPVTAATEPAAPAEGSLRDPWDGQGPDETARQVAAMGLPSWDLHRYELSGLSPEVYTEEARLHTGLVSVEAWGGAGFGDLDRRYDVRLALDEGEDLLGTYTYSTFRNGSGPVFGATVAYAPFAWLEGTLSLGLQAGHQEQSVGYEVQDGAELVESDRTEFVPGRVLLLDVAPGLRILPFAAGALKPYALVQLSLRFFPGVPVAAVDGLSYPSADGGVGLGTTLGGGLLLDASRRAYGLVEIPWTLVLTPNPVALGTDALITPPARATGVDQLLQFRAGVGMRF